MYNLKATRNCSHRSLRFNALMLLAGRQEGKLALKITAVTIPQNSHMGDRDQGLHHPNGNVCEIMQ